MIDLDKIKKYLLEFVDDLEINDSQFKDLLIKNLYIKLEKKYNKYLLDKTEIDFSAEEINIIIDNTNNELINLSLENLFNKGLINISIGENGEFLYSITKEIKKF